MSVTAVGNKNLCLIKSVFKCLCLIHSKNGRKLFVSKFFGKVNAFNLTDEDLCSLGNFNSCKSGDFVRLLTYYLCVECTVDDDCLSYLFGFASVKEVATS